MRALVCFMVSMGIVPNAVSAQVTVGFAVVTGTEVAVRATAGPEGGQVRVPIGTLVSTGDVEQQDLVLGRSIELELEPGEARTVNVPAFCIHLSRQSPRAGGRLTAIGMADPAIARLITAGRGYAEDDVQSAVWAFADGYPPRDAAAKLFLLAGLLPKRSDALASGAR